MTTSVHRKVDGRIGTLTLDRPDRLNAMSAEMLREITAAAAWFDAQPEVRVVVVHGAGRVFSAGADLSLIAGMGERDNDDDPRTRADLGRRMADAVEGMRAVTVAAIHGWCVGGALVVAAACDLRVAADDTRFSIPEVDLGIPLAWGGIPRLVREIGPAFTKELVMTGRPFDAAEAKAAGFVNRLVSAEQVLDEANNLAEQVAAKAWLSVSSTKRHVNAVTGQMVGIDRSWSDADGLLAGMADPECQQLRQSYLDGRN
jgi:enoyl-CoA hydratase/carnithine racemase